MSSTKFGLKTLGPSWFDKVNFRVNHPLLQMAFFVPVILLLFFSAILRGDLLWYQVLLYLVLGFLFNTTTDYGIHRMTHLKGIPTPIAQLHLDHHAYPDDRFINLIPPAAALFVSTSIFLGAYLFTLNLSLACVFGAGALINFLVYEWLHYGIHNFEIISPWLLKLKKHHMDHHDHPDKNFGVVTTFWDKALRTELKEQAL